MLQHNFDITQLEIGPPCLKIRAVRICFILLKLGTTCRTLQNAAVWRVVQAPAKCRNTRATVALGSTLCLRGSQVTFTVLLYFNLCLSNPILDSPRKQHDVCTAAALGPKTCSPQQRNTFFLPQYLRLYPSLRTRHGSPALYTTHLGDYHGMPSCLTWNQTEGSWFERFLFFLWSLWWVQCGHKGIARTIARSCGECRQQKDELSCSCSQSSGQQRRSSYQARALLGKSVWASFTGVCDLFFLGTFRFGESHHSFWGCLCFESLRFETLVSSCCLRVARVNWGIFESFASFL